MDIMEWLTAILDEHERIARPAQGKAPSPWHAHLEGGWVKHSGPDSYEESYGRCGGLWDSEGCFDGDISRICMDNAVAAHVARHDPAAVLADIAAKRAIIESCAYWLHEYESGVDPCASSVLSALASAYAHRPGYLDEWK